MMHRQLTKRQFLLAFFATVFVLAVVKHLVINTHNDVQEKQTELAGLSEQTQGQYVPIAAGTLQNVSGKYHRILSVPNYKVAFPDSQSVQIQAAEQWGVKPVKNREDAEARKRELVYVGENPYYHVDRLASSIPYLVPRAAVLLQDIGQAFYDSLYVKGVPFNQLIVTSVLRSMDDVEKLQRRNSNATENSCHLYGTTFDICYNRYNPIEREVRNDTLKWILSEVLRDMRQDGRCFVKYEVKQGCFHMTVR